MIPASEIALAVSALVAFLQIVKRLWGVELTTPRAKAALYFVVWLLACVAAATLAALHGLEIPADWQVILEAAYQIAVAAIAAYEGGKAVLVRLLRIF